MRISVLELGHAGIEQGLLRAMDSVFTTAAIADELGVHRLWFSEHHSADVITGTPDVLCSRVAPIVTRSRLGVAGVLLRVHSPWMVAERWATISHLVTSGLDLGIARGTVDSWRASAIGDGVPASSEDEFAGRVATLVSHLAGTIGPPLQPPPASNVQVWLHGREAESAKLARRFGLPYCHARFLGRVAPTPPWSAALAVAGVCAQSDDEARRCRSPALGVFQPCVVAGIERWARELARLAGEVDELVFVDLCTSPRDHARSIRLLAELVQQAPTGRDVDATFGPG